MNNKYNCPNCGAPIGRAEKCEYCGTLLNWIPTQYLEFVPLNTKVDLAEVSIRVPFEMLDGRSGLRFNEGKIISELSKRLAEFIVDQKAYTLLTRDDIINYDRVFVMRTFIGRR